jgi:hypothetical protein
MKKHKRDEGKVISCLVSLGMFENEREIRVDLPDGRIISALVDRRHVIVEQEPGPGREVPGYVRVSVVGFQRNIAVVDLPQPGITQGPRLTLPLSSLEAAPA